MATLGGPCCGLSAAGVRAAVVALGAYLACQSRRQGVCCLAWSFQVGATLWRMCVVCSVFVAIMLPLLDTAYFC